MNDFYFIRYNPSRKCTSNKTKDHPKQVTQMQVVDQIQGGAFGERGKGVHDAFTFELNRPLP
jgi:hypothetical protein